MISYKLLITLTVIFYIITYCNGESQDEILKKINESDESDDEILKKINESDESIDEILKKINESDESIESIELIACEEMLTYLGFERESGYYNLVYILRYKKDIKINNESFLERLVRKFKLPRMKVNVSSEEEIGQKLTEQEFMDKYDIKMDKMENHHLHDSNSINIEIHEETDRATLVELADNKHTVTEIKKKVEMTNFIYSFYKDASKVEYDEIETWIDPLIFCSMELMNKRTIAIAKKVPVEEKEQKQKKSQQEIHCYSGSYKKLLRVIKATLTIIIIKFLRDKKKTNGGIKDEELPIADGGTDDEDEEPNGDDEGIKDEERIKDQELDEKYSKIIEFTLNEENEEAILECSNSIEDFRVVVNGYMYNFEELNVFKSIVVAMDIYFHMEHSDVKTIIENMEVYQWKYFNHIISYSAQKNPGYHMFTVPSLCKTYVHEKKLKKNPNYNVIKIED